MASNNLSNAGTLPNASQVNMSSDLNNMNSFMPSNSGSNVGSKSTSRSSSSKSRNAQNGSNSLPDELRMLLGNNADLLNNISRKSSNRKSVSGDGNKDGTSDINALISDSINNANKYKGNSRNTESKQMKNILNTPSNQYYNSSSRQSSKPYYNPSSNTISSLPSLSALSPFNQSLDSVRGSSGKNVDDYTTVTNLPLELTAGIPSSTQSLSNSFKSAKNNIINTASSIRTKFVSANSEGFITTTMKVILMVLVLIGIMYGIKYILQKYQYTEMTKSILVNGTKNGKHALVLNQDPTSINYIPINRSDQQDGIQFTYNFWFLIESMDYKTGEWKHIFHKGNSSSYPNRAPGVWIHPTKNIVRIYMNSISTILEYVDIDNIPLRKWVNMSIVLNNKNMDIYVNGYLKTRKELTALPKQNNDNFWVNMYGGFEGYISNILYFAYCINATEMFDIIKTGPSAERCIDSSEIPPYLDDNWWYSSYTEQQ